MNKEEIKYIKTENGYEFSLPFLTKDELEQIDFNFHSIVNEYIKEFNNKKERTIEQRLIYDLQQENKKLNMQLDQALKDYDEEMQKNMKAIEYIEEDYKRIKKMQIGLPIEIDTSMPIYDDLLEILKGE